MTTQIAITKLLITAIIQNRWCVCGGGGGEEWGAGCGVCVCFFGVRGGGGGGGGVRACMTVNKMC